jgi:hypothetical protein
MSIRRGFGDETWRLARARDRAGLDHAAALLLDEGELEYEGHRARAFRLAVDARAADALEELNEGWSEDWPSPAAYATDVARIHFLAGNAAHALTALQLDVRSAAHFDGLADLALACVRTEPRLWRAALHVVAGGEEGFVPKARAAGAIMRARFRRAEAVPPPPERPAAPATPGS